MKKLFLITSLTLAIALSFQFGLSNVWAARKRVNCAKVMEELNTGKKVRVVAEDQKISRSSVYRCRERARAAAKKKAEEAKTKAKPGKAANDGSSKM